MRHGIILALAAVAALALGAGAQADPAPLCVVIDDSGGCASPDSPVGIGGGGAYARTTWAQVQADVAGGGYAVEASPTVVAGIASGTPPPVCYRTGAAPLGTSWGTSPIKQAIYESRVWCGNLQVQTYRASKVVLGSGGGWTVCSTSGKYQTKIGGGNGYFSTDVKTAGTFVCGPIHGWGPATMHDWQIWRCNMGGYCVRLSNGRE